MKSEYLKLKGKSPTHLNSSRISSWMLEKFVPQVIEYLVCSYEEEIVDHDLCYFSRYAQWIFIFPIKFLFQKTVFEVILWNIFS